MSTIGGSGKSMSWAMLKAKEQAGDPLRSQQEAADSLKSWEAEDTLQKQSTSSHKGATPKNEHGPSIAAPSSAAKSTLFSLSPEHDRATSLRQEHQQRKTNLAQKGAKLPNPSYQQLHDKRAEEIGDNSGTASNRVKQILALRAQGLESSEGSKHAPVPSAERVNQMRHHRSMDSSLDGLKKDPTLTLPTKTFPQGISSEPVDKLPFLQRPGPETRINAVNKDQVVRALEKHGSYRKAELQGDELKTAVNIVMKEQGIPKTKAQSIVKNTQFTGGWDKPPISKDKTKAKTGEDSPTKKLVFGRAKSLVTNINWDPQTRMRTEARGAEAPGRESYSDPNHNPQGKLMAHESPSGRGVRYSVLDTDHVAVSKNHDGSSHISKTGQDLRTLRGFTNPAPFSDKSNAAEIERARKDTLANVAKAAKEKARDWFPSLKKKK